MWPVSLYECESWTLKKAEEKRVSASEVKRLRHILSQSISLIATLRPKSRIANDRPMQLK